MENLTGSLSRSEFSCKCKCGFDTVDVELPPALQDVVDHFGGKQNVMITITSGCRCIAHNKSVGGAEDGWHPKGRAADFNLTYRDTELPVSPTKVYKYLVQKYPNKYGIGLYAGWVHLDTDSNKRRWQS